MLTKGVIVSNYQKSTFLESLAGFFGLCSVIFVLEELYDLSK